jgi:teichuronic acid biosynthesis glycosyltransferase TuaC
MMANTPRILVYSSLYPSQVRLNAGVFIRERMSRVAEHCPLVVVSPVPWFPLQSLIRYLKPDYRPQPAPYEEQNGIKVYFPHFFSIPGVFRSLDGFFMAISTLLLLYKLKKNFAFNLIDAHFTYPDGYAATLLGRWLKVPVTITLRGTEVPLSRLLGRRKRMLRALHNASGVFSVSDSLKRHVVALGAESEKIEVIGNGIDNGKFFPIDKSAARRQLHLDGNAEVLISVGGLVDRKGFHRIIEVLPGLIEKHPNLIYLIVGGASPEGNNRQKLEEQIKTLGLGKRIRFLGAMASEDLRIPLSAADIFVLATANEGWANVFLEAMACGLPVVTTDVGGNGEVVSNSSIGTLVPFGDSDALTTAIDQALKHCWNRQAIIEYAADNSWDKRVTKLLTAFNKLVN